MWRAATGPYPGPSAPDCLCWSEDNRLAFSCENVLRVLVAGECTISWRLSAEKALDMGDASLGAGSKRPRDAPDTMLLPPTSPVFAALSYSPLAVAPASGCLLCAAVSHVCTVYAPPEDSLQLNLSPVVQLAPLLHASLGHVAPPTDAQLEAVRVLRSCWSPIIAGCCYLALAGPKLLSVLCHLSGASTESATWQLAIHLQAPRGGATAVHFAPRRAAVESSAPVELLAGAVDGSVTLWRLEPSGADASTRGAVLSCTACLHVCISPALARRVTSLCAGYAPDTATDTAAAPLRVLVGAGPFVQLYRVERAAVDAHPALSEPGSASDSAPIGVLQMQAAHAHDVTSVLCLDGRWYSASHDGSILHGALVPAAYAAGDEGGGGERGAQPPPPDGPLPFDYPFLDKLRPDDGSGEAAEGGGQLSLALSASAKPIVGRASKGEYIAPPKHSRRQIIGSGAPDMSDEASEANYRVRRHVFGLARAPCGGGLAICLRAAWDDANSSNRRPTRPDNWRILLAVPPAATLHPGALPAALVEALGDASDGDTHGPVGLAGASRPLGCSLWSLGGLARALLPARRTEWLLRIERGAVALHGAARGGGSGSEGGLRALQFTHALSWKARSEPPWPQLDVKTSSAIVGEVTARDTVAPSEADARCDAQMAAVGARCARALRGAQAGSLLSELPREPSSEDAERVLPAADWLLATALTEARSLSASERAGLLACFRAVGCEASVAAVQQIDEPTDAGKKKRNKETPRDDAVATLPRRQACPICARSVGAADAACELKHTLARCWVSFRPLGLDAWQCDTCGAGSCAEYDEARMGILCANAPAGVCGLCGSPCVSPRKTILA